MILWEDESQKRKSNKKNKKWSLQKDKDHAVYENIK
jgi:hypothetical protein